MKPTILAILALPFAVCSAFALDPHVEAVTRIVEAAKGKVEKTEDGQSLKLVDLAVPGAGPHDHRKDDPYDSAFFEHLGHIPTLESLNVISTKFNDEWMPHIAKLNRLKTLRFTNNGKLTDAGMVQLAGLKDLESFSFVGTAITGRAYAKFEGFDRSESLPIIQEIKTLKRLTLTNCKATTDDDLKLIATMTQLESLELGSLLLPDVRLPLLKDLAFLKSLRLTPINEPFTPETQARIKALMPKTELKFQ
jgi:hypothetical protein